MKRKTREEKAITLIALIITIVVLLILAVVAINAVTGDGIIQHATNARSEYEKAQDKEEDMLAYYQGVLQSGEVVPTVEQLDEKYEFKYFSSLKRAIENVNGTENTAPDSNAEDAVAGIYEEGTNEYVVLMKDTQESDTINVNQSVTINLGGKTLLFTTDNAYFDFGNNISVVVDGRIGGSNIQKNVSTSNKAMMYTAVGTNLTINSGKYTMEGEFAKGTSILRSGTTDSNGNAVNISGKINVNNAQLNVTNQAAEGSGTIRAIYTVATETKIENCKITINAIIGAVRNVMLINGENKINNSNIYSNSANGYVVGVANYADLNIRNTDIYTDTDYSKNNNDAGIENNGILKFYSGNVTGTVCGLYATGAAQNYIYGGTFAGYAWGGINIISNDGKTCIENATIKNGEYKGKYDLTDVEVRQSAITIGGSSSSVNNNVYIDNCNIINEKETAPSAIELKSNGTNNKLYISNSRVTGKITAASGNTVYLGIGMDSITADQIGENVDISSKSSESFKGRDK